MAFSLDLENVLRFFFSFSGGLGNIDNVVRFHGDHRQDISTITNPTRFRKEEKLV